MNAILNAFSLEHAPQAIVCTCFMPFGAIWKQPHTHTRTHMNFTPNYRLTLSMVGVP